MWHIRLHPNTSTLAQRTAREAADAVYAYKQSFDFLEVYLASRNELVRFDWRTAAKSKRALERTMRSFELAMNAPSVREIR